MSSERSVGLVSVLRIKEQRLAIAEVPTIGRRPVSAKRVRYTVTHHSGAQGITDDSKRCDCLQEYRAGPDALAHPSAGMHDFRGVNRQNSCGTSTALR